MDFSCYGPAARSVIFQARAECAQLGETAIRPEHLLIALAACDETAPVLRCAGIELDELREQTISANGKRPAAPVRSGFAMRDLVREALRAAQSSAGARPVDPIDILLALSGTWAILRPARASMQISAVAA
jgi:ATP-dependent Clp protease ATP-binding subunit ClpA